MSSATFSGSLSAYGADIKKSNLSVMEPTVLLIGLEGFLHRCTMRVATIVSFSALTRMFSALRTDEGNSFRSISSSLDYLAGVLALQDVTKGLLWTWLVQTCIVFPLLTSNLTFHGMILHVDNFPLLLREAFLMPGR